MKRHNLLFLELVPLRGEKVRATPTKQDFGTW